MADRMSNGDLERLHGELLQAESARNYYFRELRRKEAELAELRQAFQTADETYRRLRTKSSAQEAPVVPVAPDDDVPK